jgi:pyridoxamine 5'-phosphate oxidase family protein
MPTRTRKPNHHTCSPTTLGITSDETDIMRARRALGYIQTMTADTKPLTAKESAYLAAHQLGRLATIGADGSPHVVPVAFRFNPDAMIDIGGPNLGSSQKYRNVQRDPRVAFVVDDTTPDDEPEFRPGVGRGIHIRGRAEALTNQDPPGLATPGLFSREIIRIHPQQVVSWHVDPAGPGLRILRDRGGRL